MPENRRYLVCVRAAPSAMRNQLGNMGQSSVSFAGSDNGQSFSWQDADDEVAAVEAAQPPAGATVYVIDAADVGKYKIPRRPKPEPLSDDETVVLSEEHPYADDILARARAMGWKLLHRMVWHKPNSIPLSHPTYLHIKHEWVFWLAPTIDVYRGFDKDTRTPHSETSLRRIEQPYMTRKDQRYMRRGKTNGLHPDGARPASVFTAAVGGESIDHPAIMTLKLALQLVSLSCPLGGTVLDPYCGSGTTGVAALQRGRGFVGVELEPRYAEMARDRIRDDAPLLNTPAEVAA